MDKFTSLANEILSQTILYEYVDQEEIDIYDPKYKDILDMVLVDNPHLHPDDDFEEIEELIREILLDEKPEIEDNEVIDHLRQVGTTASTGMKGLGAKLINTPAQAAKKVSKEYDDAVVKNLIPVAKQQIKRIKQMTKDAKATFKNI